MISEITQTTCAADCCNGLTNRRSKCFETKPTLSYLTNMKSVKTIWKPWVWFFKNRTSETEFSIFKT